MTIRNQTIKVHRGDTAKVTVALTNADGTPFDPTAGASIKWRMTRSQHSQESAALVRKSNAAGEGIVVVSGGVEIHLGSGDTDRLPGLYYHELKVFDSGDVATVTTGTVVIRRALLMGDSIMPSHANIALSGSVPTVAA